MTTDPNPEPTLAELELREQLYNAMDGNLRMSLRRKLLDGYRKAILASVQTATAVVSPPPATRADEQAALRDRIAEALRFWVHPTDRGEAADAVLAVLPAPADRAVALAEAERKMLEYALDQAQEKIWSEDGFTDEDQSAVDSLRRVAGEEQQPTDEDVVEAHRLALSEALGLGTGAPWDAIHERAAELHGGDEAQQQPETHSCPGDPS